MGMDTELSTINFVPLCLRVFVAIILTTRVTKENKFIHNKFDAMIAKLHLC
jgi:hypothetical protein